MHLSDPVAANRIAGGGIFVRTEEVSDTSALVRVKSHIRNLSETGECLTIVHRITGNGLDRARFGGTVQVPGGGDAETEQTFRIPNPALWSPETPALYTLETELYIGKRSIDREQTRFGIRKIVITPEGLRLNGKARFLRGVNRPVLYRQRGEDRLRPLGQRPTARCLEDQASRFRLRPHLALPLLASFSGCLRRIRYLRSGADPRLAVLR